MATLLLMALTTTMAAAAVNCSVSGAIADPTLHTQLIDPTFVHSGSFCGGPINEWLRRYSFCGGFDITAIEYGIATYYNTGIQYQLHLYTIARGDDITVRSNWDQNKIWSSGILSHSSTWNTGGGDAGQLFTYSIANGSPPTISYDACDDVIVAVEGPLPGSPSTYLLFGYNQAGQTAPAYHACGGGIPSVSDDYHFVLSLYGSPTGGLPALCASDIVVGQLDCDFYCGYCECCVGYKQDCIGAIDSTAAKDTQKAEKEVCKAEFDDCQSICDNSCVVDSDSAESTSPPV